MVPRGWLNRRRDDGRRFWCPNGHKAVFPKDTGDDGAERVKHAHEREQSEAKIADLTAQLAAAKGEQPAVDEPAESEPPRVKLPTHEPIPDEYFDVCRGTFDKRRECPECGVKYVSKKCYADHLRRAHSYDYPKMIATVKVEK
jgi:hypothetical protein